MSVTFYRPEIMPQDQCIICLENFNEAASVDEILVHDATHGLPHAFHLKCLKMIFETQGFNATCPLCRASINTTSILTATEKLYIRIKKTFANTLEVSSLLLKLTAIIGIISIPIILPGYSAGSLAHMISYVITNRTLHFPHTLLQTASAHSVAISASFFAGWSSYFYCSRYSRYSRITQLQVTSTITTLTTYAVLTLILGITAPSAN